jgi:hypothetical protein
LAGDGDLVFTFDFDWSLGCDLRFDFEESLAWDTADPPFDCRVTLFGLELLSMALLRFFTKRSDRVLQLLSLVASRPF